MYNNSKYNYAIQLRVHYIQLAAQTGSFHNIAWKTTYKTKKYYFLAQLDMSYLIEVIPIALTIL